MAADHYDVEAALNKVFELAVRLTEAMQRGLGERGLTASRAEVLLILNQKGALVQRELSEALRCTPRYVTTLVDALETEGLVRRRPHPSDRRATLVSLTEGGSSAAARMTSERQQAARWLLGDVPPRELDGFVRVADRVLERIGGVLAQPAGGGQKDASPAGESDTPRRRDTVRRRPSPSVAKRAPARKDER